MTRALRNLVALSAVSAIAAQLTTGFSFADEANSPSIIDAHAMHRRLQLTAAQTADVLCSASMYAEESCNKARAAAEAASPPPRPPGTAAPSPPPHLLGHGPSHRRRRHLSKFSTRRRLPPKAR